MDPELREIKLLRMRLGLTQARLAQEANVSQSLIAKVEAELVEPSFSSGKRILRTLHNIEQKREPCAKELMQRRVISCRKSEKLSDVINTMRKRAISQLPVLEHDNVIGIITERAIVMKMESVGPKSRVLEIMEGAPPILPGETPRRVVAELLTHYPLIIIKEKGKVIGIVSKSDLLRTV